MEDIELETIENKRFIARVHKRYGRFFAIVKDKLSAFAKEEETPRFEDKYHMTRYMCFKYDL